MWLLPILGLLAVVFLTGCSRVVYPGDGRLVLVEIDSDLNSCPLGDTTVGALARVAIRYWDQAGARLRTLDQLTSAEQEEAVRAPRLRVHGDACDEMGSAVIYNGDGIIAPTPSAQYDDYAGSIHLFTKNWAVRDTSNWLAITNTIVHECGHAIGLDHVLESYAIMYADGAQPPRTDLSDADLREHARVWP